MIGAMVLENKDKIEEHQLMKKGVMMKNEKFKTNKVFTLRKFKNFLCPQQ